jgi:putative membrane protein
MGPAMPRAFLNADAIGALRQAVQEIEARSGAELVVSVRGRSGPYLHADVLAGAVAGLATLAFLLFSPHPFGLIWILVDPVLVGGLVGLAASRLPPVRRSLTSPAGREARVRTAAEAVFHERGVHHTRDRTGVLLYVSLLERRAVLLADTGVEAQVDRREWRTAAAAVQQAMDRREGGVALAAALAPLGDLLALHVPRRPDDVNELPDEIAVETTAGPGGRGRR